MGVELEWLMETGNVILGTPSGTQEASELHRYTQQFDVPCYTQLSEVLAEAVKRIGVGAQRHNGEAAVPLAVWRTESFQEWLTAQKKAENCLDDARVEWIGRVGPSGSVVFFWILYVKVWI